ncbi:MAG TPA: hypothetical protein PK280_15490 [Planctomycetota bacterium]|nr:hypothetical protein [Planctomycetota bacterium]
MSWRAAIFAILAIAAGPAAGMGTVAGEAGARAGGQAQAPAGQEAISVQEPFTGLFDGKTHSARVGALRELLPRAAEVAAAARAEAARLRALPQPPDGSARRKILDFTLQALDSLPAEAELMKSWKPGLPPSAEASAGRVVAMDCSDQSIGVILRKASAGWGLGIDLSPAAWPAAGAMDATLGGSPTLRQFLDWLCQEQGLVCGHSADRIVLVLPASVKLRERLVAGEKR